MAGKLGLLIYNCPNAPLPHPIISFTTSLFRTLTTPPPNSQPHQWRRHHQTPPKSHPWTPTTSSPPISTPFLLNPPQTFRILNQRKSPNPTIPISTGLLRFWDSTGPYACVLTWKHRFKAHFSRKIKGSLRVGSSFWPVQSRYLSVFSFFCLLLHLVLCMFD